MPKGRDVGGAPGYEPQEGATSREGEEGVPGRQEPILSGFPFVS